MKQIGREPPEIRSVQEKKFAALLREVLRGNRFYQQKYEPLEFASTRPIGLSDRGALPLTTRWDLVEDQRIHPPFGSNLTYPVSRYTRLHYSNQAAEERLKWLDTPESWTWWLDCWNEIYGAAGVTAEDRVFIAGPSGDAIDLRSALEAGQRLGAMVVPGDGADPAAWLERMLDSEATVLVSPPEQARALVEQAERDGRTGLEGRIRVTIQPAEPAAFLGQTGRTPRTRNASLIEQAGTAETGAWGFGCGQASHLHINEAEFIAEVIDPDTGDPVPREDGARRGELVLTNLGRVGSPLIRYRSGVRVALSRQPCACGRATAVVQPAAGQTAEPAVEPAAVAAAAGGR